MLVGTAFICKPCGREQLARFALDALSTCITEPDLHARRGLWNARSLSSTEQTILATLAAGGSRRGYATQASVSSKTVDAQIGNILLKAKSAGLQIDDRRISSRPSCEPRVSRSIDRDRCVYHAPIGNIPNGQTFRLRQMIHSYSLA